MTHRPFISIIIVCYNYAHLLPRALHAIEKQQFRDFEIVFVNNGCTDNSEQIMRQFGQAHPEIPVVYVTIEKNIGLSYGDGKGIEAASGEYLMFHDADDWMDDDTLQMLADAAKSNDADRVIPAFRDVDENGSVSQVQELGEEPNYWLYNLVQGNLFRTRLYKELGIQTCTYFPDAEKTFWFSTFMNTAAYVFKPCYNMYIHRDSTSHRRDYYKRMLTDEEYSTKKLLSLCVRWLPYVKAEEYPMAVYSLTRLYYGCTIRFLRYAPLKDTFEIYENAHAYMRRCVPDYLKWTSVALKQKKAIRPYGRRVAQLLSLLERCHLMHVGLVFYHLLSSVYYFKE